VIRTVTPRERSHAMTEEEGRVTCVHCFGWTAFSFGFSFGFGFTKVGRGSDVDDLILMCWKRIVV